MSDRLIPLAPAPPEIMQPCLSLFHRLMHTFRCCEESQDTDGMILCGILASALHNLPMRLYACDTNLNVPAIREAITVGLLHRLKKENPPARIESLAREILIWEETRGSYDLAPEPFRQRYLQALNHYSLSLRGLANYADWDAARPNQWARAQGAHINAARFTNLKRLTDLLYPVPVALTNWSQFDHGAYERHRNSLSFPEQVYARSRQDYEELLDIKGTRLQ